MKNNVSPTFWKELKEIYKDYHYWGIWDDWDSKIHKVFIDKLLRK